MHKPWLLLLLLFVATTTSEAYTRHSDNNNANDGAISLIAVIFMMSFVGISMAPIYMLQAASGSQGSPWKMLMGQTT